MVAVDQKSHTGIIVTSLLAIAAPNLMLASFQYVLVGIQSEFTFSTDSANALAFMPSAASLLVVFLAGSLADRWGARRVLVIACSLYISGVVLVTVAPAMGAVIAGRLLDGVGGVAMAIVGLSIINASITDPRQRARVFGVYAAITPAMFVLAPALTALLVQAAGWRVGLLPAVLLGAGCLLAGLKYVPARQEAAAGEPLTPLLAGLVLAGIAFGITSMPVSGRFSAVALTVAAVAGVVLVAVMRRGRELSLNVRWCKEHGMVVLFVALALAAMPNLFFYTNLLLQYRYQVPLLVIALLLIVPQACAVAGGLASGPISAKVGPATAAVAGLFVSAITSLSTLVVTASAPIWVPIVALSVSAAPISFVVGPLTNILLGRAPADASGAGSSVRKATWTLGNVAGGALIGTAAFAAFQHRLTDILTADGLPQREAEIIAEEIRGGAVVDDLAARISEPLAREDLVARGPGLLEAQTYAFAVNGVLTAALYLVAGLLMVLYVRRVRTLPG